MRFRPLAAVFALMVLTSGVTALVDVPPASAATLTVTSCTDSGPGSLRQTVANASPGDTITFAVPCSTITLTSGDIQINQDLTISGPGPTALAISGNNNSAVFDVSCLPFSCLFSAAISGLTIEDGSASGIVNTSSLAIANSTFTNNTNTGTSGGGGISNTGTLTVTDSTFTDNSATNTDTNYVGGGGISNTGTLTVTNSTFTGNSSANIGGGIDNQSGSLTVTNSQFTSNTDPQGGGGLAALGTLTVTNSAIAGNTATNGYGGGGLLNLGVGTITASTISGNTSDVYGGGITNWGGGDKLTIINSTLTENTGPTGGIFTYLATLDLANNTIWTNFGEGITNFNAGPLTLTATIVGHNIGDCTNDGGNPPMVDGGYNLDDDDSCGLSTANHDLPATNPQLDSAGLQNNGGPTETIALEPGSPAIDHVTDASLCPATDQRGFARTVPCDIGAYDTDHGAVAPSGGLQITTTSLPNGTPGVAYPATALAATGGNLPYTWKLATGSGKLPKGLKLNKHTGVISGTPKKSAKSSTFTVEVLDKKIKTKGHPATQNTATKVLSITVS